ncbi:MAG: glycosyltransferase family 4 protein [Cyclobacteriaceae bacterium]
MNKVLIITYYWPPSGGSGVQRWLKFVKYLPAYDWEPHVFTPENPSFAVQDPSLEKDVPQEAEVIRFPIWEPYDVFYRMSAWFDPKKKSTPTSMMPARSGTLFQKTSTWIRGNLFVPDPRKFWVKPSVQFLSDYLTRNKIDIIITTGPPHSVHLIGLKLKLKNPQLKWLADFRDPWTEWGLWDSLMVSKLIRKVHKKMETSVLTHADEIITITPFYVKRFEHLARRPVRLLTNGFDEEDFKEIVYEKTDRFVIRHIGLVNEKCDPRPFMNALRLEMETNKDLARDVRVEFIGDVHHEFIRYVTEIEPLKRVTAFPGNIPHKQLLKMYGSSSVSLMILTGYKDPEGFLPGKLFEYLATGLPVLGTGPTQGDAAHLLKETGSGVMVESDDEQGMRAMLREAYTNWQTHPGMRAPSRRIQEFSRKQITGRLTEILKYQLEKKSGRL